MEIFYSCNFGFFYIAFLYIGGFILLGLTLLLTIKDYKEDKKIKCIDCEKLLSVRLNQVYCNDCFLKLKNNLIK